MLTGLNRLQRRQAARRWAEPLARSCLHTRHGKITAIPPGERAVRVLARAFEQMLRSGEPAVLRLSLADAVAFPGAQPDAAGAMQSWLAVGLDVEQRATYALRHLNVSDAGGDPISHRRAVERLMLAELALVCEAPGLDGHPLPIATQGAPAPGRGG